MPINEPGYQIAAFVDEVVTRREDVFRAMVPALERLLVGLLNQVALMQQDQGFDPRSLSFEHPRWTRDGHLVVDVLHNRRRFYPRDVRPWT